MWLFVPDLTQEELLGLIQRSGVEDIFVEFKRKDPAAVTTDAQREQALGERMKDILALANTRRMRPAYLIVGVTDEREILGIDAGWDDAHLQNTLRGKASRAIASCATDCNFKLLARSSSVGSK